MTKRPALLLAATSALALSCEPGCQKSLDPLLDQYAGTFGSVVSIPADDATAPTVTLVIPDLGSGPVALTATSPPLTVSLSPSSNFFVIASAEDPDGVKEIGFRGTYGVECITGDQFNQFSTGLQGPTEVNPGTSGSAFTRRWVPRLVDERLLRCGPGETRRRATITLQAYGRNFSGLTGQSGSVTFTAP